MVKPSDETGRANGLFGTVERDAKGRIGCRKPSGEFLTGSLGELAGFCVSFGGLYAHDLGKRIYLTDGIFQMENNEQVARRKAAAYSGASR